MLKALLVDDESIILEGLADHVEWADYGVELAGTASNGIRALELFREAMPELVMTDIRMPGLNGLQLIETIMKEAPDTLCIVFSGFNEFDYIKTAMKLEVIDYLEKPVTIEKIEEALERAMKKMSHRRDYALMQAREEEQRETILVKATMDLLMLGAEAEPAWRDMMRDEANRVAGVTVLAFSSEPPRFPEDGRDRKIVLKLGTEWAIALFHYERPDEAYWEDLMAVASDVPDTFGSGLTYSNVSDARRSCLEALRALRYGRFLDERGWVRIQDVGESSGEAAPLSEGEESLFFYMRTHNKNGLACQLAAIREKLIRDRLDPELVEREVLRLAYIGSEAMKDAAPAGRASGQPPISHRELSDMRTRDEMIDWLRRHLESIMDAKRVAGQPAMHQAIEKAQHYIRQHSHLDITLQEVAGHAGMNATYFSLLFKEKTGNTYIRYVTKIRIEHAKVLLREGKRVNEVCEKVGYYKYRHFTELFKKHVGCTPGQYRDQFASHAEEAGASDD